MSQLRREPIVPRGIEDNKVIIFQPERSVAGDYQGHEHEKEEDDRRYGFSHFVVLCHGRDEKI
jgi:hypothetical protein